LLHDLLGFLKRYFLSIPLLKIEIDNVCHPSFGHRIAALFGAYISMLFEVFKIGFNGAFRHRGDFILKPFLPYKRDSIVVTPVRNSL